MKRIIFNCGLLIFYSLIVISCFLNLPKFCSFLIRISLFKPRSYKNKSKTNKKIIVLYRLVGERDINIVQNTSNNLPEIFYMRRNITKVIFYYFCKKKIFFNYLQPGLELKRENNFFIKNKNDKIKLDNFWSKIIKNLKDYYGNKNISFVTFNFSYFAETALFGACKKNNVSVKLWLKECFRSKPDIDFFINSNSFKHVFQFIDKISVYNQFMKNALIALNKKNKNKISVNGCPRRSDFLIKKRYPKKIKDVLFLSFDNKMGIPRIKKNKDINWNITFDKTIKILNELSKNKSLNIVIKFKKTGSYKTKIPINKSIKVFKNGIAHKFINEADIIIGQNSASTVEALINGKYVMVPFFEEKKFFKKYLYKFNKRIIYTSEDKMKKDILNLINKKVTFPLKNKTYEKTISYYYGSSKNINEKYANFLNS